MATTPPESFAAIWRPVFADCYPSDAVVATAWARTQWLLVERYDGGLAEERCREMLGELAIASVLRAFSPSATPADTELASLAQQAALWLNAIRYDLDHLYEGYYRLLQEWGADRASGRSAG